MNATQPKTYGSEAGHWYAKDGTPCHEQPCKSRPGEFRNTTLKDARVQGLLPSVSAILGIMEKKGLDGWKKEQVAKAAYDLPRKGDFDDRDLFVQDVLELAESNMTRARDLGTEIHGAIEFYLSMISRQQFGLDEPVHAVGHYSPHTEAAVSALKNLGVWGRPFASERTFASALGYGGTIDFRAGNTIADFKAVDRLDKRLTYPDRCAQLVAYAFGSAKPTGKMLSVSDYRLANIFISTSEPGKYLVHEWNQEEKEQGWALFEACLNLWRVANRYDPRTF